MLWSLAHYLFALVAAKTRGVKIYVIVDAEQTEQKPVATQVKVGWHDQ